MIMTHEHLIRMAKEAGGGLALTMSSNPRISNAMFSGASLERFADLVIADFLQRNGQYVTNDASREAALNQARTDEREACAKACLEEAKDWPYPSHANAAATMCSMRIRAMEVKPS